MLAYLARYTHRVAISNSRLIAVDNDNVVFTWKDYRVQGRDKYKTMTLAAHEFIRRFLIHVLPKGFHRIRHYGLFANGARAEAIAQIRNLLCVTMPTTGDAPDTVDAVPVYPCPCCGGRMMIIETFERGSNPRAPPRPQCETDSS